MIVFFLACVEEPERATDPATTEPADAVEASAAGSATETEETEPDPESETEGEPSCGGAAPVVASAVATPTAFTIDGGVNVDEEGVIGATVGTSLGWVTLSAAVDDPDGDLDTWTMRVWLAPEGAPLDASAAPVGEVSGGAGEACGVPAATAEVTLTVDDVLLAPATAYHALLSVRDAAGQESAAVEVAFTTPG